MGAEPSSTVEDGSQPLHLAASAGHQPLLHWLRGRAAVWEHSEAARWAAAALSPPQKTGK